MRCLVPNHPEYPNYGGRGITVCDQWQDFKNFLADMGEPPSGKRISLGRINNDGPYCKENCRWETPKEQANNSRTNVRLTFGGKMLTMAQWAEKTGIPKWTIMRRIRAGLPIHLVLAPHLR